MVGDARLRNDRLGTTRMYRAGPRVVPSFGVPTVGDSDPEVPAGEVDMDSQTMRDSNHNSSPPLA